MQRKILIVEDDHNLVEILSYNLKWGGYQVETAFDGASALQAALRNPPHLVVLDLALPKMDGLEVCRRLRKAPATAMVPIIMLTARGEELNKEEGLDAGADDYVTKPFERHEFLARVRALLRRSHYTSERVLPPQRESISPSFNPQLTIGPVAIDISGRRVRCRGEEVVMSLRQFDLLLYLARNHGIVLTRDQLLHKVWGYDYDGDPRTLDVHIRWLREKIEEDPKNPQFLQTVRGIGYCFRADHVEDRTAAGSAI